MIIKNHKVDGAPYVPTKKKGGVITPKVIVLHFTAGWTSEGDIATLSTSDRQASAHGVLSRDGKWTQIVPFNEKAWHAGPSRLGGIQMLNGYSIGIEISNIGYLNVVEKGKSYTDEYGNKVEQRSDGIYVSGKKRVDGKLTDWPHYVHPRIGSQEKAWEPYYEPQLKALDALIPALLKAYPSIKQITTHEVIDTRGWKTDVAPHFPFSRYSSLGAEFVLEPHALKLSRPVKLPVYTDPLLIAETQAAGDAHLNENEAAPPIVGTVPVPPPTPAAVQLTPAPEKKPWLTFFGQKIAFEDAWFDNKDSDIA